MFRTRTLPGLLASIVCALSLGAGLAFSAGERFITVASTTSTENSGLFASILPRFEEQTGIAVRVVPLGTGQAIRIARNGDADVLLVHHRPSEDQFVAEGYGVDRRDLMHNDFVLVGPREDPAGVAGLEDVAAAMARIARVRAPFASRGDDSGTHKAERALWQAAGVDVQAGSGGWYRETGSGMGATLNTAAGMGAYALSDRGSWAGFKNRRDLAIVVEGDQRLFNPYGVILVNPKRFPHVKEADGRAFLDWLTSPAGQQAIAAFRIDGQQLFFPDAQ
jgi:tungstate transport system substrate-binding protein